MFEWFGPWTLVPLQELALDPRFTFLWTHFVGLIPHSSQPLLFANDDCFPWVQKAEIARRRGRHDSSRWRIDLLAFCCPDLVL